LIDYFHFFRERNKNGRETILENCGEEDWEVGGEVDGMEWEVLILLL
jgi:hypothetical protein